MSNKRNSNDYSFFYIIIKCYNKYIRMCGRMNEFNIWYNHVTKAEKAIMDNLNEREKRYLFGNSLKFGTAGIRTKMGIGTNMLNAYTIKRIALGVANYLKTISNEPSVVIGFDGRHYSKDFAISMAEVLTKNNIKVYTTNNPVPTPFTSYLTRNLGVTLGIMITASHSPKEYNGIKLYNSTGGQIASEGTFAIKDAIDQVADIFSIESASLPNDLYNIVDQKYYQTYQNYILSLIDPAKDYKQLSVVYTPQHGVGNVFMEDIFKTLGVNYHNVLEQMEINGSFPNTIEQNPEKIPAFNKAVEYALNLKADLIISHDPDADRLGVMVRHNDAYEYITGNQVAALIFSYLVSKKTGLTNPFMVKTVVSSNFIDQVAKQHNVEVLSSLTGFKNIALKIDEGMDSNKQFVFAYEEAIGYIVDQGMRDKDAFGATGVLLELSAELKQSNKTLIDNLEELYQTYGYFAEDTVVVYDETLEGAEHIKEMIQKWRSYDEDNIGGLKIINKEDYLNMPGFESSNFIKFNLENNGFVTIRPSGTEPECKYYLVVTGKTKAEAEANLQAIKDFMFRG